MITRRIRLARQREQRERRELARDLLFCQQLTVEPTCLTEPRSSRNTLKDVIGRTAFDYGKHRNFESEVFKSEVWTLRSHCPLVFFAKHVTALIEHKRRAISVTLSKLKSWSPETSFEANARPVNAISLPGHVNQRIPGEAFFTTRLAVFGN